MTGKPLLLLLAMLACPAAAHAGVSPQLFVTSAMLPDAELAKLRGGFIDINGMLMDFSFLSRLELNGTQQSSISFAASDLTHVINGAATVQSVLPPSVIQNAADNSSILEQRILNMTVSGASALMASHLQFNQLALQNLHAFK